MLNKLSNFYQNKRDSHVIGHQIENNTTDMNVSRATISLIAIG